MDDRAISDAFFTVMSIGIVVVAGIVVAGIVLALASSQGTAAADRLSGLQEPALERGVNAFYYTIDPATSDMSSPDPNLVPPDRYVEDRTDESITLDPAGLPKGSPPSNGMVIWTGYLVVPTEGDYTFSLESAGGSWLWIDGVLAVDNFGDHPLSSLTGTVHLTAGQHRVKARYFYTGQVCCRLTSTVGGTPQKLQYYH